MGQDSQVQIGQYRSTAQAMGEAALDAMNRGDIGMARTAARQAAQWARVVMQLESGEKQTEPEVERKVTSSTS
jgi:hypothetical protein